MKRTPQALLLLALWIAVLAALGWFVQRQLVVGADLRLFLPSPTTPEQHLLLEEIGEGAASRVLVLALSGAAPEELADASRALAESLRESEHFRFVSNGELSLDALPGELLPYRFLLSPTLDTQRFDAEYLRQELRARARDLASPAGSFLEPWLPRDPTLELLKVLQSWQPMQEPRREFDVWFDRAGERALLIAQTHAPAFDPDRQRVALEELQRAFAGIAARSEMRMTASGAGRFSVMMEERTRTEAQTLGAAASVGMVLLLFIAYRRAGSVVLSALPLASAGLAGLTAVSAAFGEVHGITLAFGFTLIGVAQDYPLHLLSHHRAGHAPVQVARQLWPTLATGVASTCIAYLTFLFSGVIGLAQLACFTVAGLAVAGLTTRFALPALMDEAGRDHAQSAMLDSVWTRIERLPALKWVVAGVSAAAVAIILGAPRSFWENDLSRLTPVPEDLLREDQALRSELGTPDLRYMLVLTQPGSEQALAKLESLEPRLRKLVTDGAITGYDHAARYVPSQATQLRRQRQLPHSASLRTALDAALADAPFKPGVFEPFIRDVERARELPPLTIDRLRNSPLGASVEMLLTQAGHDGADHDASDYDAAGDDAAGNDDANYDAAGNDLADYDAAGNDGADYDAAGNDLADYDAAGNDGADYDAVGRASARQPRDSRAEARPTAQDATAVVTFSGVNDVRALQAFAAAIGNGATLLDTKEASEALVAQQRVRILWSLAVAAVLLAAVVTFALRSRERIYSVLAPMAITTLLVIAALRLGGVSLTLFHLIALILAAGLGLDYALFFEHAADDRAEQRRTLHAIIVCSLSTLMVFALLATSGLPVLRAIGLTVTLGVIFNFILALLLTRPRRFTHAQ